MAQQFAILFRTWLEREGITRSQAGARLGTASQTPYDYAAGIRLPQRRLISDIAQRMDLPVEQVRDAVEADRAGRRLGGDAQDPGETERDGVAAPTSGAASVPPAAPTGAGW